MNKFTNIVTVVTGLFLITSPISQGVLGLVGGYLAYLFSNTPHQAQNIAPLLMGTLSIFSIIAFILSKTKPAQLITTIFSTLFICNFVLFSSMEHDWVPRIFYPQDFIVGSVLSFAILSSIRNVKNKKMAQTE